MAIQTLYDVGEDYKVTPKIDGGMFGTGISDCVCKGIGGEMGITTSQSSLDVQIAAGSMAIIGGGYFKLLGSEPVTVTLDANKTIYLCANIDLSLPNGSRGTFAQRTSSNMQDGNLNGSGSSRDMLLYVIKTNGIGVTEVQDKRLIKGNGTSISGVEFALGSDSINFSDNSNELEIAMDTNEVGFTSSSYTLKFRVMTQSAYNSLSTKDSHTLYFIY